MAFSCVALLGYILVTGVHRPTWPQYVE